MPLRAKCPECGHVASMPDKKGDAKNYCPRCDARLPRPTPASSTPLVIGLVAGALVLFCVVPVGGLLAYWGFRDRPAKPADNAPANAPAVPVARAMAPVLVAPAPAAPVAPPAVGELPGDGSLPPAVLDKLKAATVFVKVRSLLGTSSGSGFVLRTEGDDAYLVTNSHVVADPPGKPSRKTVKTCQVVFHSGRRTEFTMPAAVLASDDSRDLAVLRVSGIGARPNFPEALGGTPGEPRETLPVYILGFPFGGMLATGSANPAVTIGKGTVSSVREDELGETSVVQLDGDINPGNSGGPVVDSHGRLIGITVAKIVGTNIGLAIPTEHLGKMLNGRIAGITLREVPTGETGKIDLEVRVSFIDPFHRVRAAGVIVMPADATGPRSTRGPTGWTPIAGQRYPMQVADQTATVTIPMTGTGLKRYLVQPVYSNGDHDDVHAQPVTREVAFDPKARPTRPAIGPRSPRGPPQVAGPVDPYKPAGKDRPIGEVQTKEVLYAGPTKGGARGVHACLCWSADATAFFALDAGARVVRRYSFPDLTEQAKLEVGKECSWLSPCKDGLLLTVTQDQEAWVLDEATLTKRSGFAVGKTLQVVSARGSDYAYSAAGGPGRADLTVHEVKSGRPVTQQQLSGAPEQLGTLALSPDGKRLYTTGGWSGIFAHDVDGPKVEPAEQTPRILSGRFTGICLSGDGQFVCAPCGGGNGGGGAFASAPYCTLVFRGANVSAPILQLKTGAYPLVVGFDMASGLIYAQNHTDQLIILNDAGIKLKAVAIEKGRGEVIQFLVHPDGRKLVAAVSGSFGTKAVAVELPVPK